MADKIYKLTFEKDDGTTEEIQFTAPQGPQGPQGDAYVLTEEDIAEIIECVKFSTVVHTDIDTGCDLELGTEYKFVPPDSGVMTIGISIRWDGGFETLIYRDETEPVKFKFIEMNNNYATYEYCGETYSIAIDGFPNPAPTITGLRLSNFFGTIYRAIKDGTDGINGINGINGTGLYRGTVVFDEDSASSDETEIVETIDKPNGEPFIVGDMVIETNGKIWRIVDNKGHVTLVTSTKGEKGDKGDTYELTDTDKTEIAAKMVEMLGGNPVYAVIDENNIVTIKGLSEDESYTFKLEMEGGSTVDVGKFEPIQPIINQIPISIDASGNLFVGANGEKGYKSGTRLSLSSGGESTSGATDYECTGFIRAKYGDKLCIKNVDLTNENATNIVFYDINKNQIVVNGTYYGTSLYGFFITRGMQSGDVYTGTIQVTDDILKLPTTFDGYIRIGSKSITAESILTINQEIV